jgi:hypothetical protein
MQRHGTGDGIDPQKGLDGERRGRKSDFDPFAIDPAPRRAAALGFESARHASYTANAALIASELGGQEFSFE